MWWIRETFLFPVPVGLDKKRIALDASVTQHQNLPSSPVILVLNQDYQASGDTSNRRVKLTPRPLITAIARFQYTGYAWCILP